MLLSALVLFAPQTPPLQVTASDGRVTIRATRVPLFEILQELARKTGMEVVYESALPRPPSPTSKPTPSPTATPTPASKPTPTPKPTPKPTPAPSPRS